MSKSLECAAPDEQVVTSDLQQVVQLRVLGSNSCEDISQKKSYYKNTKTFADEGHYTWVDLPFAFETTNSVLFCCVVFFKKRHDYTDATI